MSRFERPVDTIIYTTSRLASSPWGIVNVAAQVGRSSGGILVRPDARSMSGHALTVERSSDPRTARSHNVRFRDLSAESNTESRDHRSQITCRRNCRVRHGESMSSTKANYWTETAVSQLRTRCLCTYRTRPGNAYVRSASSAILVL